MHVGGFVGDERAVNVVTFRYCATPRHPCCSKTNAKYPEPEKVRDEIIEVRPSAAVQCDGGSARVDRHGVAWAVVCPRRCQMLKGMLTATFCPALSLYLTRHNMSYAYCGVEPHGWGHLIMTFFVIWLGTDLWEWAYHYLGHVTTWGWSNHKYHHLFFNPSPFAVIAGA